MNENIPDEFDRKEILFIWYLINLYENRDLSIDTIEYELLYGKGVFYLNPLKDAFSDSDYHYLMMYGFFCKLLKEIWIISEIDQSTLVFYRNDILGDQGEKYLSEHSNKFYQIYGKINLTEAKKDFNDYLKLWQSGNMIVQKNGILLNYESPNKQITRVLQKIHQYIVNFNVQHIAYHIDISNVEIDEITPLIYLDSIRAIKIAPFYTLQNGETIDIEIQEKFFKDFSVEENSESRFERLRLTSGKVFNGTHLINGSQKMDLGGYELRFCEFFLNSKLPLEHASISEVMYYVYGNSDTRNDEKFASLRKGINRKAKDIGISSILFSSYEGTKIINNLLKQ